MRSWRLRSRTLSARGPSSRRRWTSYPRQTRARSSSPSRCVYLACLLATNVYPAPVSSLHKDFSDWGYLKDALQFSPLQPKAKSVNRQSERYLFGRYNRKSMQHSHSFGVDWGCDLNKLHNAGLLVDQLILTWPTNDCSQRSGGQVWLGLFIQAFSAIEVLNSNTEPAVHPPCRRGSQWRTRTTPGRTAWWCGATCCTRPARCTPPPVAPTGRQRSTRPSTTSALPAAPRTTSAPLWATTPKSSTWTCPPSRLVLPLPLCLTYKPRLYPVDPKLHIKASTWWRDYI